MELQNLRYFAAVVEAGSITAAATQLRLSQPSLSVAIGKLEAEVGVPLLIRSARGVEPTSAGRYLLSEVSRLLGDFEDLTIALRRLGLGMAGALTVAAVPALLWHRVPELLRAHAAEFPDVEIKLVDPPPWTAIDMLQDGKVDLAAIMVAEPRRFVRRHRKMFDITDWGDIPLVGALPMEESDDGSPMPLSAFDGRTLVLPRGTAAVPSLPEAVDEAFRRHGVAPGAVRTAETIQTSIPFIEAGLASAILPDPDGLSLTRFRVTVRRLEPKPTPLRALVLTRAGNSTDPAVKRLLARISSWQSPA